MYKDPSNKDVSVGSLTTVPDMHVAASAPSHCHPAPAGLSDSVWQLVDASRIVEVETIDESVTSRRSAYHAFKRVLDTALCVAALAILLVPLLVIAFIIKFESPGPVFFTQERLGKNGEPFTLIKFRSMVHDAEVEGAQWASEADPRITPFGKFIRRFRIDEIPQFLNVIKGDIALFGPRPERKEFYDLFEQYIHGFSQRMLVKPGVSGLAQVRGGYDLLPEEKIVFDIEYIKDESFLLDVRLFFETFKVVLFGKGVR